MLMNMADKPIDYTALCEFFRNVEKMKKELDQKFNAALDSRTINLTKGWLSIEGPGVLPFIAEEFYPKMQHLKSDLDTLNGELEKLVATYKK